MASEHAAASRVALLEDELRGLAEELSRCQADKEFVWSLWKRLQLSNPDLTQAVSLVVQREKQKAEVKDRKVLEILQAKDSKIETLEQRLSGQQQEINDLIQRKIAVDEENARLKNEFSNLNQKFKDKSEELKDTEECAQKKEEQNRLVIKNLEEENKGLNTRCADLLNDLEKLRKQEVQWKTEKSGSDARIKNLEADITDTREQMKELNSKCSNLSSQLAVKQEELSQKERDMTRTKKELQELQNLYRQNITHTAQQAELIQQLQALNTDTQKVLKDQEDAHTAETTSYQKLYNELTLCFETVKTSEIQLQQNCASLQEQLFGKDQKICQLQQQLQQAHDALNVLYQDSSHELQTQETDELRAAYEKRKERLQMLQTNYRALKEQLKQWEEGDSSDSEIPASETLETVIMKTVQNIDPVPDRSKQQGKKQIQDSQKPCNIAHLEGKRQRYNKKSHSKNKDVEKLQSKRKKIYYLITANPSFLRKENRTKRRNSIFQKPGYSAALLRERIKSLQQQIAVLQSEKKTAVSSVKGFKEVNEKLTTQLHLADQRLQTNKLTIQVLTSNLAKWQQEKEDLQGKLKLREHLSQTAGKSEATPAPSKNIDLEMKQMQCKLKNSNNEITKQSTTIKSLKNEVQQKEEQIRELQAKISRLERDLNMKRHLIEDLRSRLRAYQENEKACNETLDSLERKLKSLNEDCSNKKASIDSLKQRLNVATKEKSHYEQMYHKTKDELEKKDVKLSNLESKMSETERAMTELETAASQQLHGLAKQSGQALETIQKKLLFANEKVEEFMTFVKALSTELQHSIQELRIKIKQAKKKEEARACKKGLSQESILLAASILNVSTTDVEEILEVEDDEETAKTQMESEKDKEWLHKIQKLLEAQFPFATYLMDAILEKLNEKKKLVEEYSSLMKRIA
uniref:Centlein n=1 Tax=Anas platyrhynchos platyrhynchos TaxID=8840 RepID=A0A493T8K5_ANAPP